VTIPYQEWDSPLYTSTMTYAQLVDRLIHFANKVLIEIDRQSCLDNNQEYFNYIHRLYEQGYDGNPAWLYFHEHIHLCEFYHSTTRQLRLSIDYREKSGLLEKKFDVSWMAASTTTVQAGDVYLEWAELGKYPYTYWKNREPNDINRICQLAKPWLKLRPKLQIATVDFDRLNGKNIIGFNTWWSNYSEAWCRHWNIPKWDITDIMGCAVIGHADHIIISNLLEQKIYPIKIRV
jgi:hypothetical protein